MDTLALLCNLYGDGPPTLRRLRDAGCGTLAALEAVEGERLASLLRTSVRSARRFQVEGRMLRERSEALGERSARREVARLAPEPERARPVVRLGMTDPLLGRVLSAWRDQDAQSLAEQGGGSAARVETPAAVSVVAPQLEPCEESELTALDGVDSELCASLERAGVHTLEELRDADALTLAGPVGYTRLLHLQFLARRALCTHPRRSHPDVLLPQPPPTERRAGDPRQPVVSQQSAATAVAPHASLRFSPAAHPQPLLGPDFEAELERFAHEARAALERDSTGAPLTDEGGSGPFA